ncbi:MAG: hypothetical protein M3146_08565 [Thermoproteota archaeon]|nr:hypothetical protein [Thermoproteota archaeon]
MLNTYSENIKKEGGRRKYIKKKRFRQNIIETELLTYDMLKLIVFIIDYRIPLLNGPFSAIETPADASQI